MNIKETILNCIKIAREEKHFTLISEDWGHAEHGCTCALGCVVVVKAPDAEDIMSGDGKELVKFDKAIKILGVSEDWGASFIDGFDNTGVAGMAIDVDAWELGREVAKETKPMRYEEFRRMRNNEDD